MPYYRSVGEVPRKRHTQFRQPDGSLYAEELMGQEGFSSDSSLLYHRHLPTAIVAAEAFDAAARSRACAEPAAQAAPPPHPQARRRRRPTRSSAGSTCSPTTTSGSRTSSPTGRRRCTATRSATSASTSRPAGRGSSRFRRRSSRRRRLRRHPDLGDPPARAARRPGARCWPSRRPGTSGRPSATCRVRGQFLEHAPYCERDLRGPAEPLLVDGEDVEVLVQHRRGLDPAHLRATTRSTWSAGTAACTRGRSPSTTSSRSPAGCTSRRRYTRRSRARTS